MARDQKYNAATRLWNAPTLPNIHCDNMRWLGFTASLPSWNLAFHQSLNATTKPCRNRMNTPPRPALGVSAIIFDEQERVLLIRRGRPPAQGFWHVPGGKLEAGESLVEGVRREVKEETGLDVEIGPIMAVVERRQEGFHYVIIDFLAYLENPAQTAAQPADDAAACAWVAEHELHLYPIAEGFLPILERARRVRRGECLGLADINGKHTDFLPV
jgi:ADP-ribose pyrophosphatase YjhB (NUDIX family)